VRFSAVIIKLLEGGRHCPWRMVGLQIKCLSWSSCLCLWHVNLLMFFVWSCPFAGIGMSSPSSVSVWLVGNEPTS